MCVDDKRGVLIVLKKTGHISLVLELGFGGPLLAEVLLQVVETGRLLHPVLDDDAGAADHLARLALLVDLAHAGPLSEQLVVVHLDQVDAVLGAEGLHQLHVRRLVAVRREDAEKGFTPEVKEWEGGRERKCAEWSHLLAVCRNR